MMKELITEIIDDDYYFYGVDFDGTLCENAYPNIGEPKHNVIKYVKMLKARGNPIGLWTCREGQELDDAVEWSKNQGIIFDTINANLPERIKKWGSDCRKVGYDYIIDDKNISIEDIEYVMENYFNQE